MRHWIEARVKSARFIAIVVCPGGVRDSGMVRAPATLRCLTGRLCLGLVLLFSILGCVRGGFAPTGGTDHDARAVDGRRGEARGWDLSRDLGGLKPPVHTWSKSFGQDCDAFGAAVDGLGNVAVTGTCAGGVDFGGGVLGDGRLTEARASADDGK